MTEAATLTPAKPATKTTTPAVPQFALNAVNAQVGRVSDILSSAADTIDELLSSNGSALPESAQGFVKTASGKLRELSDKATEEEAGKLLETLQRTAADHPVATASIGAAIGTALGLALSRLGKANAKPTKAAS